MEIWARVYMISANAASHNVDVIFVLDSSASMSDSDLDRAKQFVADVVTHLDTGSGKVG